MRQTFPALMFLTVAFAALIPFDAHAAGDIGQPAPAVVVPGVEGPDLRSRGAEGVKVVVINFWATRCPPCQHEMPTLDTFYRSYHGRGLEMIGLAENRTHERTDVANYLRSPGLSTGIPR